MTGFFSIAALVIPLYEGRLAYLFIIFLSILGLLKALALNVCLTKRTLALWFLIYLVYLSWFYGVFLGVLKGVPVEYVFSNFLGLGFYVFLIPIFFLRIEFSDLVRFYVISCLVVMLVTFLNMLEVVINQGWLGFAGESISSGRTFMSLTHIYFLPLIAICLFRYCVSRASFYEFVSKAKLSPRFFGFTLFFVYSFFLVVPSFSKGFILAYTMCILIFVFFFLFQGMGYVGQKKYFLLTFFLISGISFVIYYTHDYILYSYSNNTASNSIRSEQFSYLMDEVGLLGSGLGSALQSGYSRDATGYGFELTYVNLVHKLGFMVFPLFFLYFITFMKSLSLFLYEKTRLNGVFSIGVMAYLIPSAGNPMLLSANFVLAHILLLVIILKSTR